MNKSPAQIKRALDLIDLVLTNKVQLEGVDKHGLQNLQAMGTALYWALFKPVTPAQQETCRKFEDFINQVDQTWSAAQDHQSLNE